MGEATTIFLSNNKLAVLSKASEAFPGKKLNEVVTRTLSEIANNRPLAEFYEIRRTDVPRAFDALLKLQSTGLAHRYIETDENEFREVLRIEVGLLDAVLHLLTLLLDVISTILVPPEGGAVGLPANLTTNFQPPRDPNPYTPTWKRGPHLISHDGPSL